MTHDWRVIRKRRSYKVQELSKLLGIHETAVYRWLRRGLRQLGSERPALILGADARAYLRQRTLSAKKPCGRGQLHCLRCRGPRSVANNTVALLPMTHSLLPTRAYLRAQCHECGCQMFQIARIDRVAARMPGVNILTQKQGE